MRKRIGALGLAAVLLLAMVCPALAANGKAEFSLKGPEGPIKAGESFTVTVEIKDNPGFVSLEFAVPYDSDLVDCTEMEQGTALDKAMSAVNPSGKDGARFAAASGTVIETDGIVAQLTFSAKADIAELKMTIQDVLLFNVNGEEVQYSLSPLGSSQSMDPGGISVPVPSEPQPVSEPEVKPEPQPDTLPQHVKDFAFTDTENHWAEGFIARAAELGLFKGYEDGSFKPNVDVTRAQYVTVLYRMADSPAVSSQAPFTDIANQSQEFRTAIAWGYENGYLNGKGEGVFDPTGPVTRQEAMKILFGYDGGVSGMETMFTGIYDQNFTDSDQLASWGKAAMYWGVFQTIIAGTSDDTLSPNGTATRAQLAKILTVYYDQKNESKQ